MYTLYVENKIKNQKTKQKLTLMIPTKRKSYSNILGTVALLMDALTDPGIEWSIKPVSLLSHDAPGMSL